VGKRDRVTSVAFPFRYRRIFVGFLIILSVGKSLWTDSDDADDLLPDYLKSETGVVSPFAAGCSWLEWMVPVLVAELKHCLQQMLSPRWHFDCTDRFLKILNQRERC
jgi:hypothetical protein